MSEWGDRLTAATTGEEFAVVLDSLFAALDAARDDDKEEDK